MKNTTNYSLKKPEITDFYNVDDFNSNMDTIDAKLKEIEDGKLDTNTFNIQKNSINQRITNMDADLGMHIGNPNNPHSVTKEQVGLGNVDNTSDLDKPISTATRTELDKKASTMEVSVHTTNKSNPHEVTKAQLGLGNVDNTSDADKPISTAVQAEIDVIKQSIIDVDALNEADGSPILLTDTAEGNLSDFKVYGRSTQDGEPTPDSPIDIVSVGTFDGELLQGYYNESGLFVPTVQYLCSKNMIHCNSGDTVKLMYSADMSSVCFVFYDENMNVVGRPTEVSTVTEFSAVAPTNTKYVHFLLRDIRGEVTPQSAKAITVTINGKQVITVKSCGKNLLKNIATSETINGVTFTINDDGSVTATGTATASTQLVIGNCNVKAGRYTLNGSPTSSGNIGLRLFDGTTHKASDTGSGCTYEVTNETNLRITIIISNDVGVNCTFYPMLRPADTDATYEPYTESVSTIQLSEPLRGINSVTDEVSPTEITRRFREIVIDGVNLTMTSADSNIAFITLENIGNNAICSHFTYHVDSRVGDNQSAGLILLDGEFCIRTTVHDRIYFKNSNFTTVDEWNTWLQANPITVVYELAEPVVETIEPISVNTYDNTTHITATGNADMWVEYYSNSNVGRRLAHTNEEMKAEHIRLQEQITDIKTVKNIVYKMSGITGAVQIGAKISGSVVELTVYRQKISEIEFYLPDLFADGYAPSAVKYAICTCINAQASNTFTGILHIATDGTCSLYDLSGTQITSDLDYTLLIFNTTWIVG